MNLMENEDVLQMVNLWEMRGKTLWPLEARYKRKLQSHWIILSSAEQNFNLKCDTLKKRLVITTVKHLV